MQLLDNISFKQVALVCALSLLLLFSCNNRPDYVLNKGDMTSLLIDIYKAEGLIEFERVKYSTDSMRKVLRQSVYMSHGVSDAEVDSSYQWYGRHLTDFIEIQDEVIARLEKEKADLSGKEVVFAEGDSVNIWDREPRFKVISGDNSALITFNIEADENSEKGDNFLLAAKLLSPTTSITDIDGVMCVEYDDGLIELRSARLLEKGGWCKIRIVSDTARVYKRIFGHFSAVALKDEIVYVDSLSLVRTRYQNDRWSLRSGQRKFRQKIEPDTIQ